jgi:hypothetical protein
MRRAIHFAVLSLLLLFMQLQGHVHPIAHLAGFAPHSQETVLLAPQAGADCIECALLAAGSNAVHGESVTTFAAAVSSGVAQPAFRSRAADVPSWFHSRAPPVLL